MRRDGGDRVGHRAEVDGDVLGLRDHAAALVEDRGRAVAALLDVRGERRADQHRAHLLGDRAQRLAEHLELDRHGSARDFHAFVTTSVLEPSRTPTHPGGTKAVAPGSSRTAGPATRSGRAGGSSTDRAWADVRGAHRHELDLARGVGVAVALLVRAMERAGEVVARPERSARRTGRGSGGRPRRRPGARPRRRAGRARLSTRSRRSSLATSPSADRTPAASGTSTRPDPELVGERARVQRPGAAERDEREVARVVAALDRDDAQRPQHLGVDDPDDRLRVEVAERALGRGAVELDPAREARGQAAEQKVRVGHRRQRPAAAVARRAGVGAGALRPDAHRPARVDAARSTRRPRRPCGCRPSAGGSAARRRGARSTARRPRPRSGRRRSTSRPCRTRSRSGTRPRRRRAPRRPRPRPGRRRARRAGCAAASSRLATPPDERITSGSGSPASAAARREAPQVPRGHRPEVRVGRGRRRALVLAELRRDLVRGDDVRIRQPPPQLLGDRALVLRMPVRVQQADGHGLRVERARARRGRAARRRRPGPIRSRTPYDRSSGTSGSGWCAQSR